MADLTPDQLDRLEEIVTHLVADARKLAEIRALAAEDGLTARFTLAKIKEVLNG